MLLLSLDALTPRIDKLPLVVLDRKFTDTIMLASGKYDTRYKPKNSEEILGALAQFNRGFNLDQAVRVSGTRKSDGLHGVLALLEPSDSGVHFSVFDGVAYVSYAYGYKEVSAGHKTPVYHRTILSFGAPYTQQLQGTAQRNGNHVAAWRVGLDWRV